MIELSCATDDTGCKVLNSLKLEEIIMSAAVKNTNSRLNNLLNTKALITVISYRMFLTNTCLTRLI